MMRKRVSPTLSLAINMMDGSKGYADITRDQLLALRESAEVEGVAEEEGNTVFPPATTCWDIWVNRAVWTVCVFDFGDTLLLALADPVVLSLPTPPGRITAGTGASDRKEAHHA
jgi:hypothetical protein